MYINHLQTDLTPQISSDSSDSSKQSESPSHFQCWWIHWFLLLHGYSSCLHKPDGEGTEEQSYTNIRLVFNKFGRVYRDTRKTNLYTPPPPPPSSKKRGYTTTKIKRRIRNRGRDLKALPVCTTQTAIGWTNTILFRWNTFQYW